MCKWAGGVHSGSWTETGWARLHSTFTITSRHLCLREDNLALYIRVTVEELVSLCMVATPKWGRYSVFLVHHFSPCKCEVFRFYQLWTDNKRMLISQCSVTSISFSFAGLQYVETDQNSVAKCVPSAEQGELVCRYLNVPPGVLSSQFLESCPTWSGFQERHLTNSFSVIFIKVEFKNRRISYNLRVILLYLQHLISLGKPLSVSFPVPQLRWEKITLLHRAIFSYSLLVLAWGH